MKKLSYLLLTFAAVMLVLASCKGPEGPAGPAGAQGIQGLTGDVGPAGATNCVDCHDNSQLITLKTNEFVGSGHDLGAASGYAGGRSGCSSCHSTQGFMASAMDGTGGPAVSDPLPINCYACHEIHTSFSVADWGLATTDATVAITGGTTVELGAGNLCTTCHQSRATANEFANFITAPTTEARAGSKRIGMHHGPQYNNLIGDGFYEFVGTTATAYPADAHMVEKTTDGCVDCHMGTDATDRNHGFEFDEFPASCEVCHVPAGVLDLDVLQAALSLEITGLVADLGTELEAAGVIAVGTHYLVEEADPDGDPGDLRPVLQTEEHLAAAFNWAGVLEDYSDGIHNPLYTRALLQNTLEVVFAYDFTPAPAK